MGPRRGPSRRSWVTPSRQQRRADGSSGLRSRNRGRRRPRARKRPRKGRGARCQLAAFADASGAGLHLSRLGEVLEGFARPQTKEKTLCARTQRRAPALSTLRKRIRRTDAAIRRTKAKARVWHAGRIPREARLPLKLPFRISERLAHFEIVPPRRTKCVVLRRRPARSQPALPRLICDSLWYYGSVILRF